MEQKAVILIREAHEADIPAMQVVRNAVKENRLSDPTVVKDADYLPFLSLRGKGWVATARGEVLGFAIVDLVDRNIWALFMNPDWEGKGIGKRLHDTMLEWYFSQTQELVWLGTAPKTRAESFYRKAGWREIGVHGKGEVKFEMGLADWQERK